MEEAQQEIRNTVTVNTSDLSTKNNDEKDAQKDADKLNKKRGGEWWLCDWRKKVDKKRKDEVRSLEIGRKRWGKDP